MRNNEVEMENDAQVAADFVSQYANNIYSGSIYDDGLLLFLAVTANTAQQWVESLKATEYAQSKDGLLWAFILRGVPELQVARASIIGERHHPDWEKYAMITDNRDKDDHTIDQALTIFRRAVQG
jgi:hypothetical protein